MKKAPLFKSISPDAIEDVWQWQSTAAAIAGARSVIRTDSVVPPLTPVGRLSDVEWGWIIAAALFGWIQTRAQQATAEGLDIEQAVRETGLNPSPWDAGAVAAILPELAEVCPGIDWSTPLSTWPKETMIGFLLTALGLIHRAMTARDLSDKGITRKSSADVIARQANAAAGGSLMTPDELNDEIGL